TPPSALPSRSPRAGHSPPQEVSMSKPLAAQSLIPLDVDDDDEKTTIRAKVRPSAPVRTAAHEEGDESPASLRSPSEPAPASRRIEDISARKTGDSMLARYFRDMASHPVMGHDEEIEAAKQVEEAEVEH